MEECVSSISDQTCSAGDAGIVGIMEASSMEKADLSSQERREFIETCGRFAVVTPPVIALLLSADGRNYAQAMRGVTTKEKKEKEKVKKIKEKPKKVK